MADPRFYSVKGPFSLGELAKICDAGLQPDCDTSLIFNDVAPLDSADAQQVSFLDNPKYLPDFKNSSAGACIVHPDRADNTPAGTAVLLSNDPYRAYAKVARVFYPEEHPPAITAPSAYVDNSAAIGADCCIEPGAVIGAGAEIGVRCVIGPNSVIGPGVVLGDDGRVGAGASLKYCIIGRNVKISAGVRIGEDGFGFASSEEGHISVPQLGRVLIGDEVEIGANTTIDRGAGPDTEIGDGCRIDNLVQIGHNVRLGRGCIIVAQVGISGSTTLGDYVAIGGQGGLSGHLHVGDGARVGAQAGVMRDVSAGASMSGTPAVPIKQFLRQATILGRLARGKAGRNG